MVLRKRKTEGLSGVEAAAINISKCRIAAGFDPYKDDH